MAKSGAEGFVKLALVVVGDGDPTFTNMCATEFSDNITNDSQPSTTTCDWDPVLKKLFRRKTIVSTGCTITLTAFNEGKTPINDILRASEIGAIRLKHNDGSWLSAEEGIIDSINHENDTKGLQTFKIEITVNGKFELLDEDPDA